MLCVRDRRAVEVVCRDGPAAVLELATLGAQFTRGAGGSLHLTREGGHSARRIVHAADVTGREIERALLAAAAAKGNITFFENHQAVDLVWDEVRRRPAVCCPAAVPRSGAAAPQGHGVALVGRRRGAGQT